MAQKRSQHRQTLSHHPQQLARPTVSSTLPPFYCPVISDAPHQTSISLSHHGGASTVHTAFPSDPVLTGLQSPLADMHSEGDQNPSIFFSPSDPTFPDYSGSYVTFSHPGSLAGDFHSSLADSAALPSRYLDVEDSSVDVGNGISSHRTESLDLLPQSSAPWSHLAATEGSGLELPAEMKPHEQGEKPPQHLTTPVRCRANSSASGHLSFRDSAYYTGEGQSQPEVESNTGGQRGSMDLPQAPSLSRPQMPEYPSSSSSTITPGIVRSRLPSESGRSTSRQHRDRASSLSCPEPECVFVAKTPSDLTKHCARHQRPHLCPFPDCPRQTPGFATLNDLDRHLKSVHSINKRNSKNYKCFAEGCTKANKEWPRLDNFKQHLLKMHGESRVEELLQKSEDWYKSESRTAQSADTASAPDETMSTPTPAAPSSTVSQPPYLQYQGSYQDPWPANSHLSMDTSAPVYPFAYNTGAIDPTLSSIPQSNQASSLQRRASNAGSAPGAPRQAIPTFNTNHLFPPGMPMQRAMSQTDYSPFQEPSQFDSDFNNPFVNMQFTPDYRYLALDPGSASIPFLGPVKYRKRKIPHTVAALEDLNPKRMKDFPTPRETPPVAQDLVEQSEDVLKFIGGSTVADSGTMPPRRPPPGISIFSAEHELPPPRLAIVEKLVDEIQSFLVDHAAKAEKILQGPLEQELVNRLRDSLRTFDTSTSGGSSISRASGLADAESPPGKTCPVTKETYFTCTVEGCKKVKNRASDLKKHMQRHSKPFGCTFDGCQKRFGSKNDWKRHEQGQHEQQECWRCPLCHEVLFHEQENYIRHMLQEHASRCADDSASHCRIARNYQGQFWCGFCNCIIKHSKSGVDATNDRFDHIAHHFTKDGRTNEEWIELGGKGKTKQAIADEARGQSQGSAQDDEDGSLEPPSVVSESTQFSSPRLPPVPSLGFMHSPRPMVSMPPQMRMTSGPSQDQGQGQSMTPRRRPAHKHHRQRLPEEVPAEYVICCQCFVSSNIGLMTTCIDPCLHHFCEYCTYDVAVTRRQSERMP